MPSTEPSWNYLLVSGSSIHTCQWAATLIVAFLWVQKYIWSSSINYIKFPTSLTVSRVSEKQYGEKGKLTTILYSARWIPVSIFFLHGPHLCSIYLHNPLAIPITCSREQQKENTTIRCSQRLLWCLKIVFTFPIRPLTVYTASKRPFSLWISFESLPLGFFWSCLWHPFP